jgi:hypothetical protein
LHPSVLQQFTENPTPKRPNLNGLHNVENAHILVPNDLPKYFKDVAF